MNALSLADDGALRCSWAAREPETAYHDTEWGVPCHDERALFEFLILEGAQAGLSWITILRKREGFRAAFAGFDVDTVATFGDDDVARLLEHGVQPGLAVVLVGEDPASATWAMALGALCMAIIVVNLLLLVRWFRPLPVASAAWKMRRWL